MSKPAFSLLEVLIAIVLLAVVVVVCVPYLRVGHERLDIGESSQFHARVVESLASTPFLDRNKITMAQYTEWARSNGWTCEQIKQINLLNEQPDTAGVWVVISDGVASSIHWASQEPEVSP